MDSPGSETTSRSAVELSQWFADEVHPHDASLKSYLRGSFPGLRDVEDVVQESYLRIWHKRTSQPIQSAKAFLFTVARHLALDFVRRARRSPIDPTGTDLTRFDVIDETASVSDAVNRAERIRLLVDAIDALPPRCRDVVILRKFKFLSQREVAARLGISERGVEIQLTRGLARCREHLRRHGVNAFFRYEA